jgi:hypothetical protein
VSPFFVAINTEKNFVKFLLSSLKIGLDPGPEMWDPEKLTSDLDQEVKKAPDLGSATLPIRMAVLSPSPHPLGVVKLSLGEVPVSFFLDRRQNSLQCIQILASNVLKCITCIFSPGKPQICSESEPIWTGFDLFAVGVDH